MATGTSSGGGGVGGQSATATNSNFTDLQGQVDQVVDIMRVNMTKVLERDEKLSDLDIRAENLADGSRQFQTTAARVKRKYWWQNCKMWVILIVVVLVVIAIIILAIVLSVKLNGSSSDPAKPPTTAAPTSNR